ncbi:MAG: hypothetical protein ABI548_27060 [Polyangiaceae bacterium]
MIKARAWFTLLLVSVGTVAATASCGSDEATGGGGGAAGGGLIGASGKAGAMGRAGSGGGTGTGTSTTLGATCGADSDCDSGMTCLLPSSTDLLGGGPSLGMCTLACASDDDCTALETGAGCIPVGEADTTTAFCFESCMTGDPGTATKCQNRSDVACRDISTNATPAPFCVPQCRADAECGAGLYCNTRNGVCTKTKPTGDPVGTACDSNATTNNCAGICIGAPDSTGAAVSGFCADLCSGLSACEFTGMKAGGFCLGALSSDFSVGDVGYCEPTCGCTADCAIQGDVCRGWGTTSAEQQLKTALGADGLCYPAVAGSVELSCGEGGAGGAGGGLPIPGDSGAGGAPAAP